ncbi:hypothetical protein LCGC14_0719430 [marine sediment metagenome]|jgi:hypothetical protein|uniref:Uncharacterized protein n=1 Tax=marine sediment metagenome TaxID=412755 RepID=A0A0F9SYC0_9ZZZZ|nr:hypothetical protein [archaeon]
MGKKKKIRDQFEEIFKTGNEKQIKKMLDKNPWLLEEVSSDLDEDMSEQNQILAALGVMEDELGGPVPIDEIVFSLRVDFNIRKSEEEVHILLNNVENLNLANRESNGWSLTSEGGRICDDYLNKNLGKLEL